jgi:hypothetical protein
MIIRRLAIMGDIDGVMARAQNFGEPEREIAIVLDQQETQR